MGSYCQIHRWALQSWRQRKRPLEDGHQTCACLRNVGNERHSLKYFPTCSRGKESTKTPKKKKVTAKKPAAKKTAKPKKKTPAKKKSTPKKAKKPATKTKKKTTTKKKP